MGAETLAKNTEAGHATPPSRVRTVAYVGFRSDQRPDVSRGLAFAHPPAGLVGSNRGDRCAISLRKMMVPTAAVMAICVTGVVANTASAATTTDPGSKYHDRVVAAVNTVHASQRKLHKPLTPFAHNYGYLQLRVWAPRARMWTARKMNPRWIIPAVFGKHAAATALCVARAESNLNPHAYNSSSAAGLYQLMSFWYNGSSSFHWKFNPFDRWQNAQHAHMLYLHDGGWRQWAGDPCVS